jgi:hypothetical protein
MPHALSVAVAVFVIVMLSAMLGGYLRTRLPGHHLESDTKDMVKAGVGLLATLASLLLGLIISSAKNSFDTLSEHLEASSVKVALLDEKLGQLGPAAAPLRERLRQEIGVRIARLREGRPPADSPTQSKGPATAMSELQRAIAALAPASEQERRAQSAAIGLVDDLERIGFMARTRSGSAVIGPLLVLITFWFGVISLGLNLFAPRNGTIRTLNVLCALSVAGAVFLILEMDQPFGGVIRLSPEPLQAAIEGG